MGEKGLPKLLKHIQYQNVPKEIFRKKKTKLLVKCVLNCVIPDAGFEAFRYPL